ncbi:hypothetical protein VTO73DRAFT_10569 [Trametes versicolor]
MPSIACVSGKLGGTMALTVAVAAARLALECFYLPLLSRARLLHLEQISSGSGWLAPLDRVRCRALQTRGTRVGELASRADVDGVDHWPGGGRDSWGVYVMPSPTISLEANHRNHPQAGGTRGVMGFSGSGPEDVCPVSLNQAAPVRSRRARNQSRAELRPSGFRPHAPPFP